MLSKFSCLILLSIIELNFYDKTKFFFTKDDIFVNKKIKMQLSGNIQTYWHLLKDLDKESKLSLIELLIQSLKKNACRKKYN